MGLFKGALYLVGYANSSCCLLFTVGAPATGTASLGTLGFGLKVPGTTAAATSTATSKNWMLKVTEEKEACLQCSVVA